MIATEEAAEDYVLIDRYNIVTLEETNQPRIKFLLKDLRASGSGPEYVIDKETGKITDKRFINERRNLTTHSTRPLDSMAFIREDWMLGSLCARPVNSGVRCCA